MTPQEVAAFEAKAAARAAVVARMADASVQLTKDDVGPMTDNEVAEYVRIGRFEGIPEDKRLRRR